VGFRQNVIRLRKDRGWSKYALGKLAKMTATQIKEIEDGENKDPRISTLQRIAEAFGTGIGPLLAETGGRRTYVVADHDEPRAEHAILVPVVGVAVGGSPQEATVQHEDYSLLHHLYKPGRYVIRLFGDSMHPTYWSNDLLLVDPKEKVRDGETALVRVDNESTVKRVFFMKKGRVQLQADNRTHPAIIVEADQEFEVEGKILKIVEGERP
jgi:SOS-response transcriptional repressor LexA